MHFFDEATLARVLNLLHLLVLLFCCRVTLDVKHPEPLEAANRMMPQPQPQPKRPAWRRATLEREVQGTKDEARDLTEESSLGLWRRGQFRLSLSPF